MDTVLKAKLIETGGDLVGKLMNIWLTAPPAARRVEEAPVATINALVERIVQPTPNVTVPLTREIPVERLGKTSNTASTITNEYNDDQEIYRHECCLKHLGGASGLLTEAYERANDSGNDSGIGESAAEKVMEALNQHATMEEDLNAMAKMIANRNDDVSRQLQSEIDKMYSGVRQFRAAAWKAGITTGGGTKDDLSAARTWNSLMYQSEYEQAKRHKGSECVASGL